MKKKKKGESKKIYKKRWISLEKAVNIVNWYYKNTKLKYIYPEFNITKGGVERFEYTLESVLKYDFFSINKIFNDENVIVRERFYALVFAAEHKTKVISSIRKLLDYSSLNKINEKVNQKNTILLMQNREKSFKEGLPGEMLYEIYNKHISDFTKKKLDFFKELLITDKEITLITEYMYEETIKLSNQITEINNALFNKISKGDEDLNKFINNLIDSIRVNDEEDIKLNFENIDFALSVAWALSLRQAELTNSIMVENQLEMYEEFAELPIIDENDKMSINNIVIQTGTFTSLDDRNAQVRKIQRIVKDYYEPFIDKINKLSMIKLIDEEKIKVIFIHLLLKDNIEDTNENKRVKEPNIIKVIKKVAKGEDINSYEYDYINNYFLYKSHELFLGEKTYWFMLKRVEIEKKLTQQFKREIIEYINNF